MQAIKAILEGNDEARKADAIAALGRSADNSTQLTFLNLLDDQSLSALRPQIIAASITYNSHPSRIGNENYSRQAWKQILWRLKNYEEKEPALLALKDVQNQWVTDLLEEYANLKTAPKLASLASGILANRKK